uniref:Uncharacterized protein n=1 Tax=Anguilla anguilla TaxID=7936 RepID=A0A0E9VZI4_ANGAN
MAALLICISYSLLFGNLHIQKLLLNSHITVIIGHLGILSELIFILLISTKMYILERDACL